MSGLNMGMSHGDHSPLARRVEDIERFLQGYQNTLVGGRDAAGFPMLYPVLAGAGTPDGQIFKPFSFALDRHENGAMCYFGSLVVGFTYATVSYNFASTPPLTVTQVEVAQPTAYPATNLNTVDNWSYTPTKLDWFGAVYLVWECDATGVIDPESVKVVGPDEPTHVPIPEHPTMSPPDVCRYFKKIGTVPKTGNITQDLAGDVYWYFHLLRGGGTTVGSGGGGSGP